MTLHLLRTTTAAAALLTSAFAVHAADLPRPYKAPIYAPPIYSWNGFYVGANGGYGFGNTDVALAPTSASFNGVFAAGDVPSTASIDPKGYVVGAQIGYNYQFGPSWLAGIEADLDYSAIKSSDTIDMGPVAPFAPSTTTLEHKMDWFGTVRGRAGYIPWEPLLIYATGGLAVGHVKDTASIAFPSIGQLYSGESTATQWGWTVGGGAEWAFLSRWTVKAEYLYYDLGDNTVNMTRVSGPAGTASATFQAKGQIVRAGVNYRF